MFFFFLQTKDTVRSGDTIGAGYEWIPAPDGGPPNCAFFFTYNGRRLPNVPHLIMPTSDTDTGFQRDRTELNIAMGVEAVTCVCAVCEARAGAACDRVVGVGLVLGDLHTHTQEQHVLARHSCWPIVER